MAQSGPVVTVLPDPEAVARAGADALEHAVAAATRRNARAAVALSGGSTPKRMLALLADAKEPWRSRVAWSALHLFWGDERHVPSEHADSNYRMTREALLGAGLVPEQNVHRVPSELPQARDVAARYESELREFFGDVAWPRFDLVFLGMGADGHTASLFPGTTALDERARWVAATHVEKLKADRITLTYPVFAAAHRVVFLVTGADKATTLHDVLRGPPRPKELPSQGVAPTDGELVWLLDRAAAADL